MGTALGAPATARCKGVWAKQLMQVMELRSSAKKGLFRERVEGSVIRCSGGASTASMRTWFGSGAPTAAWIPWILCRIA